MINEGYLAIPEQYEKLIISLRTAQAKEYSLDKEQTSYSDIKFQLPKSVLDRVLQIMNDMTRPNQVTNLDIH
jgi:hypothetical protein